MQDENTVSEYEDFKNQTKMHDKLLKKLDAISQDTTLSNDQITLKMQAAFKEFGIDSDNDARQTYARLDSARLKYEMQHIPISKYIFRFSWVYLIALILIGFILTVLGIEGSSGSGVGALLAAVMMTIDRFLKDNKRVPIEKEQSKLVWGSLLASYLVSFMLAFLTLSASGELNSVLNMMIELGSIKLVLIMAMITLVYFLILKFAYSSFPKTCYKTMKKKGQI